MGRFGPKVQPCSSCGKEFTPTETKYHVVLQKDIVHGKTFQVKSRSTLHHLYLCRDCAKDFYDFMMVFSNNNGGAVWM